MSQVIINDIFPYTQAVAILGQTVYSTNWTANAASDVIVYSTPFGNAPNDVTQILASNQYSVAFVGSGNIVQVTLVTPSAAGDIITITRQTPADYLNLYSNTNFTPSMLNNDFGILTLVDQQAQLVNQLIAPRYNYSALITDVVDTILPVLQANQIWIKNSSNTGIIAVDLSAASSGTVDVGLANELAYYQVNGNTVSGLPTANNGVLITSSLGVPSISSTLPSAVQLNISKLGMQTQNLNMGNFLVNNMATPLVATDGANKGYADSIAAGLNPIEGVQAASTVNLTVTYNNGSSGVGATITNADTQAAWVIDGYTVQVGDRILIKNQTSTFQNGIYVATNVGSNSTNWVATRASDYNSSSNIQKGDLTSVINGAQMGSSWIQTQTVTTVGTDAILFSAFFLPANYVSSALTSGSIYVGNASNIATGVAVTGAVSITNAGVTALPMAANSIKGNNTGSPANAIDLTVAQTKTLLNTAPQTTVLITGTAATYTTPTGALYLTVKMAGGGGGSGGSSSDTSATNGSNGTDSTFGSLTASHGAGGAKSVSGSGGLGGAGGGATGGDVNYGGIQGQSGSNFVGVAYSPTALGGNSVLFPGAGTQLNLDGVVTAGVAPIANTGSGGSGTGGNITSVGGSGAGGGAGSLTSLIASPSSTYTYTVGVGGAAGAAGTAGAAGAKGSDGIIIVTAYFQ